MKSNIFTKAKKRIASVIVAGLLVGCAENKTPSSEVWQSAIQPPIEELTQQFAIYTLNATKGDTLFSHLGTRIIIPPLSLVDNSEKTVTDEVTIKYREYHDALDVFLSGIPMDYNSNGEKLTFQTASMFEIKAEQNGKELKLAEGNKIDIRFASYEGGTDYDFFQYDEKGNKWDFVDYSKPVVNLKKEEIKMEKILQLNSTQAIHLDKNHFVLNYLDFLDVYFNEDFNKIYNNKDKPEFQNKAASYGLKVFDISYNKYSKVSHKGREYPISFIVWKNLSGVWFPAWTEGCMGDADRIREDVYRLTVNKFKKNTFGILEKTFSIKAKCVMPLNELFAASSEQWKEEYKKYEQKLAEYEKLMAMEAEVYRSVKLSGFGIFNFDKLQKRNNTLETIVSFEFDEKENDNKFKNTIYCFPSDNKTVITLSTLGKSNLYLDPKENNFRIIAVISGPRIAVFSSDKYNKIDFDALKKMKNASYNFVLETYKDTISSKDDLKKILYL